MKNRVIYWHIQMNQPHGRGKIKIDSKKMLSENPPVIGTGDWDDFQCRDFTGENENGMKVGDVVLVREGKKPIALCEVKSENFQNPDLQSLYKNKNFRKVEILSFFDDLAKNLLKKSLDKFDKKSIQTTGTLSICRNDNATSYFINQWHLNFNNKNKMEDYLNLLNTNQNLILTGAPGTGKTYLAKQMAQQMILGEIKDEEEMTGEEKKIMEEHCGFVQFHPSYDYTDFVEGLRPTSPDANGNIGFELRNGVFKDFCVRAKTKVKSKTEDNFDDVWELFLEEIKKAIAQGQLTKIGKWEYGLSTKDSLKYSSTNTPSQYSFTITKNNVYAAYQGKMARPSGAFQKDMEDVVDYLKDNYNLSPYQKKSTEQLVSDKPFIFIIDEINRGEISKIFGELFFSIDPGYRGAKGKVKTQYANLQEGETVFDLDLGEGWFYIPENVYIIGTMNDIDRSVESMDFAMRRRFAWQEIIATERAGMLDEVVPDFAKDAKVRMNALNDKIEKVQGLNSAYHIGPSYFLKLKNYQKSENPFEDLWNYHLKGILSEYLRGYPNAEEELKKLESAYSLRNTEEENQNE